MVQTSTQVGRFGTRCNVNEPNTKKIDSCRWALGGQRRNVERGAASYPDNKFARPTVSVSADWHRTKTGIDPIGRTEYHVKQNIGHIKCIKNETDKTSHQQKHRILRHGVSRTSKVTETVTHIETGAEVDLKRFCHRCCRCSPERGQGSALLAFGR